MSKEKFMLALQKAGIDMSLCRVIYKEKGKYNESEIWLYPKETGTTGILITKETIQDINYLREYIYQFTYKNI